MRKLWIVLIVILQYSIASAQNVGINDDNTSPHASAMLDVKSLSKGLLIPRVALTATNSASPVSSPLTSLLVYNTATAGSGSTAVTPGFYYWNGASWERITTASTPLNAWSLGGNSGTDATINFIGTTDDENLVFKVHSVRSGFINKTHSNTALGFSGMSPDISGTANTAIGVAALLNNSSGNNNSALGLQSLFVNTTGGDNTATGYNALSANTTGGNNTAVGSQALISNVGGSFNTAVGYEANVTNSGLTNATDRKSVV